MKFKINSLYYTDAYKTGHMKMLAPGTTYTTNSKFSRYWDKTDRCFSIRDHLKIINLF